ncbi:phage portal protein [Sphingobacterium sp. UT-1RO-CII-1]|uniref:phage portal protein n=1 Tax=Sphingobacterium sp. UT-1RO-CII-1 TaxID=2995225 RepID=UPI00227BC06A|nr:phage portal protein [Sphingobacterium sp. UT-1RO-CII-1]
MVDIVKGIRSLVRGDAKQSTGLPYPTWQFVGGMWVQMADTGANYIDKAYKVNSYLHSIVHTIADRASDAPIGVFRIKDEAKAHGYKMLTKGKQDAATIKKSVILKTQAFEEIKEHEFAKKLNGKPNTYQTGKQLRRELHGYKLITGNSYMYASVVGGNFSNGFKPVHLWCIPSPCVNIVSGDRLHPVSGYQVSYFSEEIIDPRQISHFKDFNPVSEVVGGQWLYGLSRLSAGRGTISGFEEAQKAQGTLFHNMGPAGIISGNSDKGPDEETAVAIQDKFEQRHTGSLNGGRIMVTPADVKFTAIGISPVDLNIIEAKGDYLQELCALYNFPKERITGSQNTASQGLADKQVITSCVLPALHDFDDVMTERVRTWYGDESLVVISDTQYFPELQENMKELSEWLDRSWWISTNEKRRVMDYDEVDGGDVMLVPMGLAPLEDVVSSTVEPDVDMLERENAL